MRAASPGDGDGPLLLTSKQLQSSSRHLAWHSCWSTSAVYAHLWPESQYFRLCGMYSMLVELALVYAVYPLTDSVRLKLWDFATTLHLSLLSRRRCACGAGSSPSAAGKDCSNTMADGSAA